ncbi:methyl-accepting chemotaxis protein [Sphingomonas sp. NCPPB 2930]
MFFSNAKLGTKLGAAFAAIVLLTLLLGGFAIYQLSQLYERTDNLANNLLPSVSVLGKIQLHTATIRRAESSYVLSVDQKDFDSNAARITAAKQAVEKNVVVYESMLSNEEDARLTKQLRAALTDYYATQVNLVGFARQGESGFAQAKAYYQGPSRTAVQKVFDITQSLVDLNEKLSVAASEESAKNYSSARTWLVGILASITVVAVALAITIVRSVTRQLGGEPGTAADLARSVAGGDLSGSIGLRQGDETSMMAQLKRMQDSLIGVVSGVRGNAESVATASAQISQGNADLSQRTEEQASALEETAASMEELNSTVRQNADNARQANQLAVNASSVAERGGAVVGQVVETMRGINEGSKRIADIISVIDGIAFQTNILALNAAVEAARAGEQGRGFAVVASEVRGLAQRSADAAKEIKALISSSVSQVEQGTALVDQAGTTMREVVDAIRRVTDIMGEISAASHEQSQGVAQVGEAITQMDQVTQQNAALVEESAAAASSLKQQAQQLVEAVAVFTLAHGAAKPQGATVATRASSPSAAPSPVARPPVVRPSVPRPPAAGPAPVPRLQAQTPPKAAAKAPPTAPAGNADDWESF